MPKLSLVYMQVQTLGHIFMFPKALETEWAPRASDLRFQGPNLSAYSGFYKS